MQHESIIIVGGGPVGLITAITLAQAKKNVLILDANSTIKSDSRVLALSIASFMQIQGLGIDLIQYATPINKVHISHHGLGVSNIKASDVNLEQLGYTINYSDLCQLLYAKIQDKSGDLAQINIRHAFVKNVIPGKSYATVVCTCNNTDELQTADLIILAEGGNLKQENVNYKTHNYAQMAVIARIKTQKAHNNIAYERFEYDGPLVLLPYNDEYTLVWSVTNELAENLLDRRNLQNKLQKLGFMQRFGEFTVNSEVASYPLKLQIAHERVLDRVVLIGNSSQVVHLVSANGLNMCLCVIN